MSRNTSRKSQVSYAGVQVMMMSGSFGTTPTSVTPAVSPRKKYPRRYHAGRRIYARRHLRRHRRVGLTYAHHHNHRRLDYRTVKLAIARTLCRRWDVPRECAQIVKGCISDRAEQQVRRSNAGSFIHQVSHIKTTSILSHLCTGLYLQVPPHWCQDLSRTCHDAIIYDHSGGCIP